MSMAIVAHAWKGSVGSIEGDNVGQADGVEAVGFCEGASKVGDAEGSGIGD